MSKPFTMALINNYAKSNKKGTETSIKNNKIEGRSRDGRIKSTRIRFVRHKHLLYIPMLAF